MPSGFVFTRARVALVGFTVLALGAVPYLWWCSQRAPAPAGVSSPVPFDVQQVVQKLRLAFHEDGAGWRGGAQTYEVRAREGSFSFKPRAGEGVRFETVAALRGATALPLTGTRTTQDEQGQLVVHRGALRERLANGVEGLEQSWVLDERPAGEGSLTVKVKVDAPLLASNERGLHFSAGSLVVRYGHATWIDARGVKTAVRSTWSGEVIVLEVPSEVVAGSSYPAVLDPLVSAELGVDLPQWESAQYDQYESSLAWNGTEYLLAYTATGEGADSNGQAYLNVLGARLDATGALLDPTGFFISALPSSKHRAPDVASDGSGFFVTWQDDRNAEDIWRVYGARVTAAGVVADPTGLQLSLNAGDRPRVAYANGRYLVVWTQQQADLNVFGGRVDTAGNVLDGPAGFPISSSASSAERFPDVDSDGTGFLVVWEDARAGSGDIYGARVTSAGMVLDPAAFAIASATGVQATPAVAWNGVTHLVAWSDFRTLARYEIYGARVSPTGVVSPAATANFPIATGGAGMWRPAISAFGTSGTGTTFLVAWEDTRNPTPDVYGARVTNTAVLDSPPLFLMNASDRQLEPTLASDGTGILMGWSFRVGSSPYDVMGRTVTSAASLGPSILWSKAANAEQAPAVASSGSNYFVVWQDYRALGQDIWGARLSSTGAMLDPAGIAISTAASTQSAPDVAYVAGADQYLVVWTDGRNATPDVYGARVSSAGALLDPLGVVIGSATGAQTEPSIASDGTRALVTWTDDRNGNRDVYAAFFHADAGVSPSTAGFPIIQQAGNQSAAEVGWNGFHFLAAWADARNTNQHIYGTRVSAAGVVLEAGGVDLTSSPVAGNRGNPDVAAVGGTFLVTFWDSRNFATDLTDIYGTRVSTSAALSLLDGSAGFPIATGPLSQNSAAVAGDGTNFQVVWTQSVSGNPPYTLQGRRVVASTGALLDGAAGQLISAPTDLGLQRFPALASAGPRSFLLAYQAFHRPPGDNNERVRARLLSNAPPTVPPLTASVAEDGNVVITFAGMDLDGDPLTYSVQTPPSQGTLTGSGDSRTYTPALNYNGADSFTYVANDGVVASVAGTVTITVNAVNDTPVAQAQSASTPEDTPKALTLVGTDVEGSSLSYTIVSQPSFGTLSPPNGTSAARTYTPSLHYFGADSFTFRVNDGTVNSPEATVTLTVTAVNDAPTVTSTIPSTPEETPLAVTLSGFDADNNPLTFTVTATPTNGALTGTAPNLTYTPNLNFNGPDVIRFRANDGTVDSAEGTVTISVTAVNDAPVASGSALGTPQDTALVLTLIATDVDATALNYVIVTPPTRGTLTGTGSSRTYTPNTGAVGNDSFTFKANDGSLDSNVATITIAVASVNQPPVATVQSISTPEDTARTLTLAGTDPESNPLTFTVVGLPQHGTLTGTAPALTFTPVANYVGADAFTFKANDGTLDSLATATVSITITAGNDLPVANAANLSVQEDSTLNLTLTGSDPDGDLLSYVVLTQPLHGALSGTPPALVYTPVADYAGLDAFTFKVNDGTVDSAAAQVTLTITPVNDAPVAQPQSITTPQDTPRNITLSGTDPDMNLLTFIILTQPANGTLSGLPPNLTYSPNAAFRGNDTFTFKVTDGLQDSAPASVGISVSAVNNAPVAIEQSPTMAEDTTLNLTLAATDRDNDPLTYAVVVQPANGIVTGTGASVVYTPNPNFNGVDTFTFRANDGVVGSNGGVIRVTVTAVDDAPTAAAQSVSTAEDSAVSIVLTGADVDGEVLSFTLVDPPMHGSLTGNPPNLTYVPELHFAGNDLLTFTVRAGSSTSAAATVSIGVSPVNDAPTVESLAVSTAEGSPVAVVLKGSDVEREPLTFTVVAAPGRGTLEGTPPELTYSPEPGFIGTDTFTYAASDGVVLSAAGAVTVTVTPSGSPIVRDTTEVNGWSCGCSSGSGGGSGGWLLALLGGWAVARRRRARGVLLAVLLVVPLAAQAKPAKATAKKKPTVSAPAPVVAPAPPPAAPAPAEPAPPPAAPGLPTLAALDVVVTVPNEKLDAASFSEILATAADQSKLFRVTSARDLATIIGVERQKQLLGCSDDTGCLVELANALGARYLLQGSVGKVGNTYLVSVRLIDSGRSRAVGRGQAQTSDPNLLLNLVWKATQQTLDSWGTTLPPGEATRVAARPQLEPAVATAPSTWKLGVMASAVGSYQPLAASGSRASVGAEVAATLRLGRFDLGAGVVISPTPGARISATFALFHGDNRLSAGLRGTYFPGAGVFGGGAVVEYERALGDIFALRAHVAGEAYASQQGPVIALLGGVGAAARF